MQLEGSLQAQAAVGSGLCNMQGMGMLCTDSPDPIATSHEGAALHPWTAETSNYVEGQDLGWS